MWMALIMAFNVWFIIWPNQQKILGLVEATAEQKAAAAKPALYASRFNTMFSIGMLYCMVAQQNMPSDPGLKHHQKQGPVGPCFHLRLGIVHPHNMLRHSCVLITIACWEFRLSVVADRGFRVVRA
jgi:Predicted membrane protein